MNNINKWYQGGIDLGDGTKSKALVDCNLIWDKMNIKKSDIHNKKVLDNCCNTGFFSFKSVECDAKEVFAYDNNKESIDIAQKIAKKRGIKNITFINDNYDNLDFNSIGKVDVSFVNRCLYHLKNGKEALNKICDITNETIILFTLIWTYPNKNHVGIKEWETQNWRYIPTFEELNKDLKNKGFKIVHIDALDENQLIDCGLKGNKKIQTNHRIIFKAKRINHENS